MQLKTHRLTGFWISVLSMEKSRNALDIRECAANSCLAVSPRFILHRTDQQPAPATSSPDNPQPDLDVPAPDICKPQAIACGNISAAAEHLPEACNQIKAIAERQRGAGNPAAAHFPAPSEAGSPIEGVCSNTSYIKSQRSNEGEHLPEAGNPIKAIAGRQRGAGNPATAHSPAPGEAAQGALCWYPMRVTYNRQLRVKANLDRLGVENFLPMRDHTERRNGRIRHSRRPAISNLIFVRSTMERITKLKHTDPVSALMRYMTRRPVDRPDAPAEILTVPEREMDNFIKATAGPESEYTYLRPDELRGHEHGRVLICSGPFAGVEGTIKRIHGTRHVVIELNGIGGVCINFIPRSSMIEI